MQMLTVFWTWRFFSSTNKDLSVWSAQLRPLMRVNSIKTIKAGSQELEKNVRRSGTRTVSVCLSVCQLRTRPPEQQRINGGHWRRLPQCILDPRPAHTHSRSRRRRRVLGSRALVPAARYNCYLTCPTFLPPACLIHLHQGLGLPLARDKRSRNLTKSIHLDQLLASFCSPREVNLIQDSTCFQFVKSLF